MPVSTAISYSPPIPGVVDVWVVRLGDDHGPADPADPADAARASRFLNPVDRRRFERAHQSLRSIACAYSAAALASVPNQRPALADAAIELSLAHVDDLALVAVAATSVGVDVETLDIPHDDLEDMAAFTLSTPEQHAWYAATDRRLAFQRSWVRKEAVLKASGVGIGDVPLPEVEVNATCEQPRVTGPFGSDLTLVDLDPCPGFVGAVAVAADSASVSVRDWFGSCA